MRRPNYFKIGLFVLVAGLVAVLAVIAFGIGAFFEDRLRVETYFESSVQGLDVGSPVKFRGVQIGRVEEMTVVQREYDTRRRYVLVRMALDREALGGGAGITRSGIEREVEQGLRARLGFQGVTGAAYVEVDYLDPGRYPPLEIDWQPKHAYIPASPSIIARIGEAVDGILRNLERINVEGIATSLEGALNSLTRTLNGVEMEKIGDQAEGLLRELRQTNRNLDAFVRDLREGPLLADADAALKGVRSLVERSEAPLAEFLDNANRAASHLDTVLERLAVSGDLAESAARLNSLLGRLDRLAYGQQGEIEQAIANLREMSENFRELSEALRDQPSQLFFGAPPPRPLEESR